MLEGMRPQSTRRDPVTIWDLISQVDLEWPKDFYSGGNKIKLSF